MWTHEDGVALNTTDGVLQVDAVNRNTAGIYTCTASRGNVTQSLHLIVRVICKFNVLVYDLVSKIVTQLLTYLSIIKLMLCTGVDDIMRLYHYLKLNASLKEYN